MLDMLESSQENKIQYINPGIQSRFQLIVITYYDKCQSMWGCQIDMRIDGNYMYYSK